MWEEYNCIFQWRKSTYIPQHNWWFEQESSRDYEAKKQQEIIKQEWSEKRNMVIKDLQDFWGIWDELMVEEGVILKGHRVYIPKGSRLNIIKIIYLAHPRSESCIQWPKKFFWPKMSEVIKSEIGNYVPKHSFAKSRPLHKRRKLLFHIILQNTHGSLCQWSISVFLMNTILLSRITVLHSLR